MEHKKKKNDDRLGHNRFIRIVTLFAIAFLLSVLIRANMKEDVPLQRTLPVMMGSIDPTPDIEATEQLIMTRTVLP